MPGQFGSRIPLWKKFLFSVIVLFAVVLLAEVSLKLLGIGSPPEVADYIANWDAQWQSDFFLYEPAPALGVNSDGVRDYQHHIENSGNRVRIVCLGDSVTFGYMLEHVDSFPALLERRLTEFGQNAEVFNIALPGWSTRQQRIAYQTIARKYHPHYVILGFCLNDVPEMHNNLAPPPRAFGWLYQHSYLVRSLLDVKGREIGRVEELFDVPASRSVQSGWQLCYEELRELARDVEQDGGAFVLLILPFRFQIGPDAPAPVAQQNLLRFADDHRIEAIDALPAIRKCGPEAFIDYDHLSRTGAELVVSEVIRSRPAFLAPKERTMVGGSSFKPTTGGGSLNAR